MAKRPERELAVRAEEVLRNLSMWRLPVDPYAIAREEEIEVVSGEFKAGFDGRIKYLAPVDTYSLAYRIAGPGRPEGRVRFTIGHELGHYYLHGDYLRSGKSHNSKADFRSNDEMEQEADEFAAALLMPIELFRKAVANFRQSVCTLKEVCQLSDKLGTSATSTIRRYCQADIEPVAAIFSREGKVWWSCYSEDMKRLGMGYVRYGSAIPEESVTAGALSARKDFADGERTADLWFEKPYYSGKVWEETMRLGETGVTITYLTLCDNPWHDSDR